MLISLPILKSQKSQEEHCFKGYTNEEIFGIDSHFTHSKTELLTVIRYLGDQPGNQVWEGSLLCISNLLLLFKGVWLIFNLFISVVMTADSSWLT